MIFFLAWSIYVIRKSGMSWHTVISIYVITLFVVDFGDVPFDFWFNFYDMPVHLLTNLDFGHYLGIVISDGLIFPLIAIVFCYYSVQYNRPWLLSFIFASLLGIIEYFFVKRGFMVYHSWNHWITPVLTFILLRLLSHFSNRLVNYFPPVSYKFRLLCFIYVITEWPGAIMGQGILRFYQYRLNIFQNETADDRFVAMMFATTMGGLAAILISKIPQKFKSIFFLGLGLSSSIFALWMHSKELLIYHHWNNLVTIIRYMTPYLIIILYDHWESAYTRKPYSKLQ